LKILVPIAHFHFINFVDLTIRVAILKSYIIFIEITVHGVDKKTTIQIFNIA